MKTIKLIRRRHRGMTCIFIYCEYDQVFNRLVRDFHGIKWSNSTSSWYVIEHEGCVRNIIGYFKNNFRIDATNLHQSGEVSGKNMHDNHTVSGSFMGPVRMTVDAVKSKLVIKFMGRYDKKWISELRQYCRPYYDAIRKEWHLPASKVIIDSLTDYFHNEGVQVIFKKAVKPKIVKEARENIINEIRKRHLSAEIDNSINDLRQFLQEQRYSRHTIDSYISHLELFFKYLHHKQPVDINNDNISEFMDAVVIKQGYSASFQNQLLSAIKAYYYYHGRGKTNLEEIKRPRKSKPLPHVLSKEEVTRILQCTRNIKHRLLLYIIYSCGLRRSEVINIRLSDLNRDRKALHIRSGKGNIDRVVPVSDKVWSRLDEYLVAYNPAVYLFEGQNGGKYSVGSVYHVFCQSLKRAGIDKDLGVHSLRHSYATHLHEGGLDIRYIQELLGHKSSKTTEIYTHVSRRNLLTIKNPLDDLDVQ